MNGLPRTRRIAAAVAAAGILVLCTGATATAAKPVAAASETREGPQFYTGLTVDVSGEVDGDVYVAGQSVTISGDVTGDVIAAAQTITVTGTVDGNVRLAGQDVTITGTVAHSGTVFAANLTVSDPASFGDDVVGAVSGARIDGEIGRDLLVSVGRLSIDGSIGGNLTYTSDNDARITEGAVAGTIERLEPTRIPKVEVSPWAAIVGWLLGLLYALVALSLVTLLAGLLFPRWLQQVTGHLLPSPGKALLVGFVATIAIPGALLSLLVTIVGAPLALFGILVWLLLTLASFVYAAFYLGRLVLRGGQRPVTRSLIGGAILIAALQIPWLNIAVWLAMVFFGLGAQLLEFHSQRPWRPRTQAEIALQPQEKIPVGANDPTRLQI
ncbi:MAG: polymer-forming cytoskeletal protein [Microbacterium sp.]